VLFGNLLAAWLLSADSCRVCPAWHRAGEVKVLVPGFRRAENQEKGKGVIVKWGLKEAQFKRAGRRTATGYEVWCTRDERARDCEVLHLRLGCALQIRRLRA
jgi:hypothetical protein